MRCAGVRIPVDLGIRDATLEAMACGVPVLTTHASLPEVVGEDAVVTDPIRRRTSPQLERLCGRGTAAAVKAAGPKRAAVHPERSAERLVRSIRRRRE
ncbi:MAG: hypothetical protein ACLUOF_02345 [Ruminococcus sp.]